MGYCVDISIGGMDFPKDKVPAVLAAINALHLPENMKGSGGSWSGGKQTSRCYSWTSNPGPGGFKTLTDAFHAWRYDAHEDPEGNVHLDYFSGEKWGDDEVLYGAIAPFVPEDGYIECRGEDGHQWRYLFDGKGYKEQSAKVSWE